MPDLEELEAPVDVSVQLGPVAPWPHTVFILAVLGLWASYGALRSYSSASAMMHGVRYTASIVMQCLLVGSTIAGLYRRRDFITGILGRIAPWGIAADVGRGFLLYLGGLVVMLAIGLVIRPSHLSYQRAVVQALLPHSFPDLALWVLVSLAAGVCEEFVFRGYLLQQLSRWFGSPAPAIGASALLFGCMHLYEGTGPVIEIVGLGVLYGIFAVRDGNLRRVMAAHFFLDAITGTVLFLHGAR